MLSILLSSNIGTINLSDVECCLNWWNLLMLMPWLFSAFLHPLIFSFFPIGSLFLDYPCTFPPPPPHPFSPSVSTCPPCRGAPAHLSPGLHLLHQWHGGQLGLAKPQGDGGTPQRRWPILTGLTHWTVQGLRWWVCVYAISVWVRELDLRKKIISSSRL